MKDGDCNVIEHRNNHVTVIDVCNAAPKAMPFQTFGMARTILGGRSMTPPPLPGDFGQKEFPVNPIDYLKQRNINDVFRFMLTDPDMDHMDGMKAFFEHFQPTNFWDTDNNKTIDWSKDKSGKFNEEDWKFYLSLRKGTNQSTKRLTLYSNSTGKYSTWLRMVAAVVTAHILAPTPTLIADANEKCENYHGCSYVILYITGDKPHKILLGGNSHDDTWDHILNNHKAVTDVEVLIAPARVNHFETGAHGI